MQVNGKSPDYRQEMTEFDTVLHPEHRFVYVPPRDRRWRGGCGVSGCWDQFAIALPCAHSSETEDTPTLMVRVLQPLPQNTTFQVTPAGSQQGNPKSLSPKPQNLNPAA